MAFRMQWAWDMSLPTVLAGAKEKLAHHRKRLEYYRTQLTAAEEKIRSGEGIEWPQSVNNLEFALTRTVMPANNNGPQVRPELAREMATFKTKIAQHEQQVTDYKSWVAVLSRLEAPTILQLQYDDLEYFGLDR